MDAADVTVVTSPYEQELLAGMTSARTVLVPNVHAASPLATSLAAREGVVFVGSFMHHPNEDAIEWFVTEVMPGVWESEPQERLTIVGQKPPPRVLDLASDRVDITGWVPRTGPYYEKARVAVAPLRFGAGVKGKVGEAMSQGVPTVMTPVASEGMGIISGQHALVAVDPVEFAEAVVSLLRDDVLWRRLSAEGQRHIQEHFGVDAMRNSVEAALNAARPHEEARPA